MKAISQPKARAMPGMIKGATKAQICAPALNKPVAKPRSFFGKYSAVIFTAEGKFPDSPIATMTRMHKNNHTLTVDTAKATLPVVRMAAKCSRVASKLYSHLPSSMPFDKMLVNACKVAPTTHVPKAQR